MNKIKLFVGFNKNETTLQNLEKEVNDFLATVGDKVYDTTCSINSQTQDSYAEIVIMVKYSD